MIVWKNCKFGRVDFGRHNMHGWIACDKAGNVRGSITQASHQDMEKFKALKAAVAADNNIDFESILPDGWTSYPDLRSAAQ